MTDLMAFDWNSFTGRAGVSGAIFYGLLKLFKEIEDKVDEETKREVADWLLRKRNAGTHSDWATTIENLFNRYFGKKHLSWRCFGRSSIISFAVFSVVFLVWPSYDLLQQHGVSAAIHFAKKDIAGYFEVFPGCIFAILPDYISLFVTRLTIRLARRWKSAWSRLLLLILDAYASAVVLSAAAMFGIPVFIFLIFAPIDMTHHTTLQYLTHGLAFSGELLLHPETYRAIFRLGNMTLLTAVFPMSAPYFFSAVATSIWLWLYVASGILLRSVERFDFGLSWLLRRLDVKNKPLQAVGFVSAVLAVSVFWIGSFAIGASGFVQRALHTHTVAISHPEKRPSGRLG